MGGATRWKRADPQTEAPVDGFDVHVQAVATGRPVAALLTHERLLPAVLGGLVHAQLRASQEGFGTLGTLWKIPAGVHVVFSLTARVLTHSRLTAWGLG